MDYTTRILSQPPADIHKPVIVDADASNQHITWAEYASAVKRIGVFLQQLGLSDQDGLGLLARNDIWYYVLADGAIGAGATFAGIPPADTKDKLVTYLRVAQIRWLFVAPEFSQIAEDAATDASLAELKVIIFDPPGATQAHGSKLAFSSFLDADDSLWTNRNASSNSRKRIALRMFTSGTTGNVKAVELSHAALVARIDARDFVPSPADTSQLQYINLSSAGGQMICQRAFAGYLPAYVSNYGDEVSIMDRIQRWKISVVQMPPRTMELITMTVRAGKRSADCLNSLSTIIVGGASSRPEGVAEFASILPKHTCLRSGYGSTEYGIVAMTPASLDKQWRPGPGYVGFLPPGTELQIIDHETLQALPSHQEGEICVRGETLFSGYCNNPSATQEILLDDDNGGATWFRTGDRGYLDPKNQQLALTGRFNEMFTAGLARIVPAEIEAELMKHVAIDDAAVAAVRARDVEGDNECIAYVVRKAECQPSASDVFRFIESRLGAAKAPTGGVIFCESIPRNGMKKVMRHQLKGLEALAGSQRYLEGSAPGSRRDSGTTKGVEGSTNDLEGVASEPARKVQECNTTVKVPQTSSAEAVSGTQTANGTNDLKAKRWDHRLTREAIHRKGNSMISSAKCLDELELISLGGGLPSTEYFPIHAVELHVPFASARPSRHVHERRSAALPIGKQDVAQGRSQVDISTALQYGQANGIPQLLQYVTEHTKLVHKPQYQDWGCIMTNGNTAAFDMLLRMFSRPGDWMLSEEYTFVAAVETAAPLGVKTSAVEMDGEGMRAEDLDEVLSTWDYARGPKPFLVYTVPTGHNPTGVTQTAQRRRQIYRMAQKHDLLIVEDEPYYFLQMQEPHEKPLTHREEFLQSLVPSYLSMDTDGRVVRMDSFSKVVAPGMRAGWVTAPKQIVERFRRHAELSTQGPSGMSQLVLYSLLQSHWGHEGFLDWMMHLRVEYSARRDALLAACQRHLPDGLVTWNVPRAGMFLWLRIHHAAWKSASNGQSQGTAEELEERMAEAVLRHKTHLLQGSWFRPDRRQKLTGVYFRATFAAAPFDRIDEGIRRLGAAVREVFQLP
ncbi:hypothetical protein CKM354_000006300 [Cercospora kikuchii]|uniref:Uncharacterized protein n=1 Tax=Cercospora kikuchii TaxID=84275 RepID=A0A9P3C5A1_9PEZI|nr:uncharacterized protein CKM354_000006300 [Cercospora kikuchii]GIZ36593.1 hypothetical protein CKM354_000006300 [Cercospora kikuchii]